MTRERTPRGAARCAHGHGHTICFECFKEGSERTKARQDAWAQRALPFDAAGRAGEARPLNAAGLAHRQRMLAYLETMTRKRA